MMKYLAIFGSLLAWLATPNAGNLVSADESS
jgi:hypothetical protein